MSQISTVVKATCSFPDGSGCGDVRTEVSSVTLRYLKETPYDGAQYRFVCPKCKRIVLKDTSPDVANILYTAGVKVERYEHSIEILQRPNDDVAAISLDDVLDLGLAFQNENEEQWFRELMGE